MQTKPLSVAGVVAMLLFGCVVPQQGPQNGGPDSPSDPPGSYALVGSWVQDDSGPVVTYRRRYDFRPDGAYEFLVTVRNTGSVDESLVAREAGRYAVEGERLVITPESAPPRAVSWRIEPEPNTGAVQLVLLLSDGTRDVYYLL